MARRTIPSRGMEPFRNLGSIEAAYALQEAMAEHPEEFESLSLSQVQPFITDKEYIACLMKADICSSEEKKHTWKLNYRKNTYCSGCYRRFHRGMYCLKCLTTVHLQCYSRAPHCNIKYYNESNSVEFYHTYSNVVMDGDCDVCDEPITKRRKGRECRWCAMTVHRQCALYREQCYSPKYRNYLFPPVIRRGRRCSVPLLVFINPKAEDGYGDKLMQEFLRILHPMQVIDVTVTDPLLAFQRYSFVGPFIIFIIGGDGLCCYTLKGYSMIRNQLMVEPKFRFIPLGPYAEIGRSLGGRINYSKKSAKELIEQIPYLITYNLDTWKVFEEIMFKNKELICRGFIFNFVFGMETYLDSSFKGEKIWNRFIRRIIPDSIYEEYKRRQVIRRWGSCPEPLMAEHLVLEIDGKEVDLSERPYVAIVLKNRILRQGEYRRNQDIPSITDGTVDIYGLTQYCLLTNRNIERKGIKLGQSNNVKVTLTRNIPYQADGHCNLARYIQPGEDRRDVYLRPDFPLEVLGVRNRFPNIFYLPEGERPLDTSECFIDRKLREQELERQRREWAELEEEENRRRELAGQQEEEAMRAEEEVPEGERRRLEEEVHILIAKFLVEVSEIRKAEEAEAAARGEEPDEEKQLEHERLMHKVMAKDARRAFLEQKAVRDKKIAKEKAAERRKAEQKAEAERKKAVQEKIARERSAAEAARKKFLEEKMQREISMAKDEQEAGPSKCKDEEPRDDKDEMKKARAEEYTSEKTTKDETKKKGNQEVEI